MAMDDRSTRAHALELASRHGLPPEMTLKAARQYLAFITNTEPDEWFVFGSGGVGSGVGSGVGKGVAKKAAPKKAASRKRA